MSDYGHNAAIDAAAQAIARYDFNSKLSSNDSPGRHQRAEAEVAILAAVPYIRRVVLLEAADEAAKSDWAWLRIDAEFWLRQRAGVAID